MDWWMIAVSFVGGAFLLTLAFIFALLFVGIKAYYRRDLDE